MFKSSLIVLLLVQTSFAAGPEWRELSGDASRIGEPRAVIVGSEERWRALWKEHSGGGLDQPPAVDFSREVVVAVFLGRKSSGGIRVRLELVDDKTRPGALRVLYSERRPKSGGFSTTVMTSPYAFLKLAAPPASVRVEDAQRAQGSSVNFSQGLSRVSEAIKSLF